ncbi:MAG: hypothetical protein WCH34_14330 [Bacteroidota bacterium]
MGKNANVVANKKRCIAAWRIKTNVSEKADYFEAAWNKMKLNSLFSTFVTEITAAIALIAIFRTAIQSAQGGGGGKVAERKTAELNVDIAADSMLYFVQKVADANMVNGAAIIESVDAYVITRSKVEKDEFEVYHGVKSGSFDFYHKPLDGRFAVLFMMSTDNVHWDLADFSHSSKGYIEGLIVGQRYYFKSMTSSANGKSGWSVTIDILCE